MIHLQTDAQSRREFIKHAGIGGACLAVGSSMLSGCGDSTATSKVPTDRADSAESVQWIDIELNINKQKHTLKVDTRTTLLDLLREKLDLTGAKKGCDHGQCGACTVLVNGKTLNSCLALAALHSGSEITTIEGLGSETDLHPVQAAFIKHDAFQCGYCTPGQIMSAAALVDSGKTMNAEQLREYMSGNICRCGAYPNIIAAIMEVQKTPAAKIPELKA